MFNPRAATDYITLRVLDPNSIQIINISWVIYLLSVKYIFFLNYNLFFYLVLNIFLFSDLNLHINIMHFSNNAF